MVRYTFQNTPLTKFIEILCPILDLHTYVNLMYIVRTVRHLTLMATVAYCHWRILRILYHSSAAPFCCNSSPENIPYSWKYIQAELKISVEQAFEL